MIHKHIRQCIETDLLSCGVLLQKIYAEPPYEESWAESRATAYLESFFRIDADGAFVATENDGKIIGAVFVLASVIHGTPAQFFSSKSCLLPGNIVAKELPAIL